MSTMKKNFIAGLLAVSLAGSQLVGCANMGSTETGAAIGALGGAALGATVSKNNRAVGALAGAAVGALAGGLIGNYMDRQKATRAEAAKKYHYDARSDKLEVEKASVSPQTVAQGQSFDAMVEYTALTPNASEQIKLTEARTLVMGQDSIDLGRREVVRTQGTHTSTAKVTVPQDLPKGKYTLVTTISDGTTTRNARSSLTVS